MVERQGGGNAAGVIRVTPAANYPANVTVHCEEQLFGLLCALTRLDIGAIPSLRRVIAGALSLDYAPLIDNLGVPLPESALSMLQGFQQSAHSAEPQSQA